MLICGALAGVPAAARAAQLPTITLDRDGPVTVLVQSKAAFDALGVSVVSPAPVAVCSDCKGGETAHLGTLGRGTEVVLRLQDGENTYLSTDPAHARITQSGGTWRIGWDDAGGDGDYNDLITTVAIPAPAPPVDRDGDGFSPPADCLDTNSSVHPGAVEIPGNGLDDDCVGGDAPARVAAVVSVRWTAAKPNVRLVQLSVRGAPAKARIGIRCLGKRCRFKHRRATADRHGRAQLLRLIPRRRLRPGTTLEVSITAPNMIGKVLRYRVRRFRFSAGTTLCLPPGKKRPVRC